MNYKIESIPRFEKDVKKLKKKFPKIKNDLVELVNNLSQNAELGIDLGSNIFKIRIPNSSIPTGKSGGLLFNNKFCDNRKMVGVAQSFMLFWSLPTHLPSKNSFFVK